MEDKIMKIELAKISMLNIINEGFLSLAESLKSIKKRLDEETQG